MLGLVCLATGMGFLESVALAWYLGLAISFLDIIRRIFPVGYGEIVSLVGIFVELVIIFYVLELRVQQCFGVGRVTRAG